MSTIDRNDFLGKSSEAVNSVQILHERNRAIEARRGGAKIRQEAWWDHKYDCGNAKSREGSMQRCSLYAMWDRLPGETYHLMPYFITDGHW